MDGNPSRPNRFQKPLLGEVCGSGVVPFQDFHLGLRTRLWECHRVTSFLQEEPGQSDQIGRRAQAIWEEGFMQCRLSGSQRKGNFVSGLNLQQKRKVALMN